MLLNISYNISITNRTMAQLQVSGLAFFSNLSPPSPYHYLFACSWVQSYTIKYFSVDCGNHTFVGSSSHFCWLFVCGINEIRILIRQPYFDVQARLLNEKSSAKKITQQNPDKLQNAKWLIPGRELPKAKHQIYFIILKPNIGFTSLP